MDGGQGLRTMGRKDIHGLVGEVCGHEAGHALYQLPHPLVFDTGHLVFPSIRLQG